MQHIDQLGIFWLADHPDDTLSGRLIFDPADRAVRLTLIGAFSASSAEDSKLRILGWVGTDQITIENAYHAGRSARSPGLEESYYRANQMFKGHHLEDAELHFASTRFVLADLSSWIGAKGSKFDRVTDDRGKTTYKIDYALPESSEASFSRGRVSIVFGATFENEATGDVAIKQSVAVRIDYGAQQPIRTIRKDVSRIQSLVILCTGASTILDSFVVSRPEIKDRMLDGSESTHSKLIEVLAAPINYISTEERKPQPVHRMLLTYGELGGTPAVARWIDESKAFERPLEYFVSIRLAKQMYAQNRFLNATFAAEAFHRITVGGSRSADSDFRRILDECVRAVPQHHREWLERELVHNDEPTLRQRLVALVKEADSCIRPIIGNSKRRARWAFTCSQVRNEVTHIGSRVDKIDGEDLFFLAESVYDVVRICLLLVAGAPVEVLERKAASYATTWYKDRLWERVEKLREMLMAGA
ncbi:HEPN domain-containing protein [Actinoplanes sp. NPDC089786]|uniref:ApeA N-terminal domain 1-containing protein n=1 Tax=Actinoplanes sp. NPDC089786 TaxID=3155185 RepID=UPI00342146F3